MCVCVCAWIVIFLRVCFFSGLVVFHSKVFWSYAFVQGKCACLHPNIFILERFPPFLCWHQKGPAEGGSACLNCARGQYAGSGASACSDCAAGTVAPSQGLAACAPCGAGAFSGAGAQVCVACTSGYYAAASGSTGCSACDSGRFR